MPTRNVNLTDELDNAIRARVESGRYENASEVVRDALRALAERDERHAEYIESLRRDIEISRAQFAQGEFHTGTATEHMARIDALVKKHVQETPLP